MKFSYQRLGPEGEPRGEPCPIEEPTTLFDNGDRIRLVPSEVTVHTNMSERTIPQLEIAYDDHLHDIADCTSFVTPVAEPAAGMRHILLDSAESRIDLRAVRSQPTKEGIRIFSSV